MERIGSACLRWRRARWSGRWWDEGEEKKRRERGEEREKERNLVNFISLLVYFVPHAWAYGTSLNTKRGPGKLILWPWRCFIRSCFSRFILFTRDVTEMIITCNFVHHRESSIVRLFLPTCFVILKKEKAPKKIATGYLNPFHTDGWERSLFIIIKSERALLTK